MSPEIYEYKKLNYKGKTVFSKMVMGDFNRIEKYFQADEACFMFIENGDLLLRTPHKVLHFKSGEALFAKCGNYFFENQFEKTMSENKTALIAAYFHPDIMVELFTRDIFLSKYQTKYDANKVIIDKLLFNFKENISLLLDNSHLVDEVLILTKLKEFLILLSKTDNAPNVIDFVSSFFKPYEYNFKIIIEKNIYSSLSLTEFAKLCGMSLATFKRKFTNYYSEPPKKYILIKKLEKAQQLLSNKENRIVDIAYDCGFETITTFNRNFKKYFGKSPTGFRENR